MKNCLILIAVLCSWLGSAWAQYDTSVLFRTSPSLRVLMQQAKNSDSIDVVMVLQEQIKIRRVLSAYEPAGVVVVRVTKKELEALLANKSIHFADIVKKPKEELTSGKHDLAVNRINLAHHRFPSVKGSGILVSIKEQSPDTMDLDLKGRFRNTGMSAPNITSHANIMATTVAGGGNTSPFAVGAAPAAIITSTSFSNLLPEPDAYYRQNNISIQNHSYGTVSENYYGAEALAYDHSIFNNPGLVAVFSSGNAGTAAGTGPYANLQGYGNITGNFKLAKNGITVGAIDSFYQVPAASSKGPAFDGRIKPELVAFGDDGTSGAAAVVSGTAALLQQAYRSMQGKLPAAALVKAILLNAAEDVGAPGPDHASGFGSLQAHDAVAAVVSGNFFEDSIGQNAMKTFSIRVGQNTAWLKATLSWTDPPATANTNRALVNDLDLVLQNATSGEQWHPWVLSTAAHMDSITKSAVRGRDSVNNVEQISLSLPAAGDYFLTVKGSTVRNGVQPFAIAFDSDTINHFEFTFPTASDPVQAGKRNILRWQTTFTGKAALWVRYNGNAWTLVEENLDLSIPYSRWDAPDTVAQVQLRMQPAGNVSFESDHFIISRDLQLQTGFNCNDSFMLYWNKLPVAGYQLYAMGERYMEPVLQTADTAVILQKINYPQLHFSVAPVVSGNPGMRSFTINYSAQGSDCYIRSFYLQFQDQAHASFFALLGTTYRVDSVTIQKWNGQLFVKHSSNAVQTSAGFTFRDSSLQQGINLYRLRVKLKNGSLLYSEPVSMVHFPFKDVIVFPNPVRQNANLQIAVGEPGKYRMELFDAAGRKVMEMMLLNAVNPIPHRLTPGVYIINFLAEEGGRSTQKLVIY